MKDLKKDMIDSLKENLISKSRKSNSINKANEVEVHQIISNSSHSADTTASASHVNEIMKSPAQAVEFVRHKSEIKVSELKVAEQNEVETKQSVVEDSIPTEILNDSTNSADLEVASDYSDVEEEAVDDDSSGLEIAPTAPTSSSSPPPDSTNELAVQAVERNIYVESVIEISTGTNNSNDTSSHGPSSKVLDVPAKPFSSLPKPQAKNLANSVVSFLPSNPNPTQTKLPPPKPIIVSFSRQLLKFKLFSIDSMFLCY
jgi:hypothetical protein